MFSMMYSDMSRGVGCYPLSVVDHFVNKFLVSKETVVLRQWERSKQKFGF